MGRPLPRIPQDNSFKIVMAIVVAFVICGSMVVYFNYYAADQGGTKGATSTHPQRVPSPSVQNDR